MRSQTGGVISLGRGIIHEKSIIRKINTKRSTEFKVVGFSDYLPNNIQIKNFLRYQGYHIKSNVLYQDNQSAKRIEENGRNSCTGNSRHIDIRYFFSKDWVDKKEIIIKYCPTTKKSCWFLYKTFTRSFVSVLSGYINGLRIYRKDH